MRRRAPIAVVALAVLLNLANTPAQERRSTLNPKPPSSADARELSARIDTLLIARQADSVQAIVARSLPDAFAEGDSALVSALLLARAQANQMGGRMREAREAFAAVREWAEGSRDSARWMDALGGGAYSAGVLGMRDESVALNTRLLEIALATDDLIREARARTGRAYVAMVGGDLASARAGYARSIRLYRMAGDGRAELVPLVGLGRVYSSLGQIDSARACFKRVWLSATEMGQQVEAAHALNNLGTLEHRYGDLMLAMQYYQTAFEIHRAQGETMGAMTAASNLALAHQACGRYDKAAEILQEQLAVCEDAGTRPQAGLVLKNLGFAYASARRIQSANATFRRAAAMGDTLDVQVRIDALWGLADALAVDSLDAAIEVLRTGIETIGQGDLTLDLKSRLTLARLLLDRQDGEDAIIEIRRALSASEGLPPDRMGAHLLLIASRGYSAVGKPDSALILLDAGVDALRAIHSGASHPAGRSYMNDLVRAARALLEYPADRPPPERHAAFFDLLEEFRATNQRESVSDPRRTRGEAARPVTLRQMQQDILAPGDLLLEFFVASKTSYLFVASRDTAACVTLPGIFSPLERQIEDFCGAVAERPSTHSMSDADLANLQLALGQTLFGSVADLVMRAERLLIVPDRHLHTLPFGLLAMTNSAGEAVTLLDRASIFVLPSASVLATAPEPDSIDADGDGAFLVVSAGGESGASLRGAQAEARALGSRYSGVVECRGPVTPEELCHRMEDSRIIHIAAHVDVNDQEPWYSGIQVGSAPSVKALPAVRSAPTSSMEIMEILSAEDSLLVARTFAPDPFLRAHQVADLSLSARLAVLSGCESALGKLTVGEGVIGLGSAFMHAGVPTVVGSLWKIDDRTTVDLMKSLYDGLADGISVAQALRRAQLEMRSRARTAHPFYWAGFVVVGDGRQTVPLVRKSSLVPVATIAASLLLLTAAGWFVMRTTRKRESQRPL